MLAALGIGTAAQAPRKTAWDGVFTADQARRGQELYKRNCGTCHADNLKGAQDCSTAPPLVGSPFTHAWRDKTISQLFLTIGETMPRDNPASLTPEKVADIVAFVLMANEAPPGPAELPADLDQLDQIVFTEKP